MTCNQLFAFFLFCLAACSAQIAVVDLTVHNLLKMQLGLGWPHRLNVAEGHEALMRVELDNPESCVVTTPAGLQFEVHTPPSNRFESWSDGCGVRARNVTEEDEGRWRLNATRGNETIAGWTEMFVDKDTTSYTAPDISLVDGQNNTQVELTSLDNSYCVVAQPFSESSLVPGHCRVTLDRATRAVQGNWNVLLGLPGKVAELPLQRRVAVESERLDVGYVRDTTANKLHMYCNILHTTKNITFCRFQKTSSSSGFNVMDGLSDGSHSYYGDGFLLRECGMTIEQPTVQDYGTWRCSVGVQQWVGTTVQQQAPLQALISIGYENTRVRSVDTYSDEEPHTVFVREDESFTVMCRADVSLAYCWFQHPNGSQFTPTPIVHEEQAYWYTGENLQTGDCGITFTHATPEESGEWICHMGPGSQLGLEITDRVEVRVTGPLAANQKEISTKIGDSITLYCHSSNGNRPLDYCRFLTPNVVGFRIDSTLTEDQPILGRYYFTPERNLDYGDCSLTIKEVLEEDLGEWTCAALINEDSVEARDTIRVYVPESSPSTDPASLSRAGIVGMAIGASVLAVTLVGFLIYKMCLPAKRIRNPVPPSQTELVTMDTINSNRSSLGSQNSGNGGEVEIMDRQNQ